MPADSSIAETLRARRADLTQGELRVAQTLLADYPSAGLQSAAALAKAAGVSTPTVVRLIAKLGLDGWGAVQAQLRGELSAQSAGPAQLIPAKRPADSVLGRFEHDLVAGLQQTLQGTDPVEFSRAVDLLADDDREVLVAGGRVSCSLAGYLARYLSLVRHGVRTVEPESSARGLAALDVGPRHVVVAFDYRRYDTGMVAFGRETVERGAELVLCTDAYLSPLSSAATVLLTSSVAGPPPFISLTAATALVEAVTLGVVEARGPRVRDRFEAFDRVSRDPRTFRRP